MTDPARHVHIEAFHVVQWAPLDNPGEPDEPWVNVGRADSPDAARARLSECQGLAEFAGARFRIIRREVHTFDTVID